MPTFNCEGVLWRFSHCSRIGVFIWRACFQISLFYPQISVLLPLSISTDGELVVPTNRSWSLDKARAQGALLNVSFEKTPTRSSSAANAPPINGKEDSPLLSINGIEVSPVLEMQKLGIPAVCFQGVIT